MIKKLDKWLNSITMYKLILYGLALLAGVAVIFGALGTLHYSVGSLAGSLLLVVGLCFGINILLAKLYRVPVNQESSFITGLILFFIMSPPNNLESWLALVTASVVAIASKYVITWHRANIVNPAAIGALVVSLTNTGSASWWVASKPMFIFVLIVGLLVVRKLRRFRLWYSFVIPATALSMFWLMHSGVYFTSALQTTFFSFPILFLASFMLTEPATMPNTTEKRVIFGVIVGLLFASRLKLGYITMAPHTALIIGNLFAFGVSFRASVRLKLIRKMEMAPDIYDFTFAPDQPLKFSAGQYMDWTIPGVKIDSHGNRRTFTIASSPREQEVHMGLKIYQPSSAFKTKIMSLEPGEYIEGSHVAGDFTLPHVTDQKLVFIAGGIGITPFRAMAADIILCNVQCDVVLFYLTSSAVDIVYKDVWQAVEKHGFITIPITDNGRLTTELLNELVPDFKERIYYISGPSSMVDVYKAMLKSMSISSPNIRTDYFSGY